MYMLKKAQFHIHAIMLVVAFSSTLSLAQVSSLSKGYQRYLNTGLDLKTVVHIPLISGQFQDAIWYQSGFTSMNLHKYVYEQWLGDGVVRLPQAPNAIPFSNWIYDADNDVVVINPAYMPYLRELQYADEQEITEANLPAIASAVATLKSRYPNALIYTNQGVSASGWSVSNGITPTVLKNYQAAVQPDMLSFTEYPFRWQGTGYPAQDYEGGSPTSMYVHMEMYRKAGLAGNDGTGNTPIPVSMYVQTFADTSLNGRLPTESEFRLQQFAAWAFGMRAIDTWVYIRTEDDEGLFFEGRTQTPTAAFYQYAELNRQSSNLGPALVKLISSDVRMSMGQHKNTSNVTVTNTLPSGMTAWNSTADEFLKQVTATNMGTLNDGLKGDVIVGFLNPLDASLVEPGAEDDTYFMVVNGLTDENGSAAACSQMIRLDFDFADSGITQLLRLSRLTGLVETVELISDGGSLYHLNLLLEGGTGDLFKYDTGTAFVPEPATIALLGGGIVTLMSRRRKA